MDLKTGTKVGEQPTYEVIKKEDLAAAVRDAIVAANAGMTAQLDELIDLYSATAPSSLWAWGYTSRWDFDLWW